MANIIDVEINVNKDVTPISPLLFGHFIENMYDCIDPGLHAQVLKSRGFERPDKQGNGVSEPWLPVGEGQYSLDSDRVLAPSFSQRICSFPNLQSCGIKQENLPLFSGEAYEGSFWAYTEGSASLSLEIMTENGLQLFFGKYELKQNIWEKYSFHFTSEHSCLSKLVILVSENSEVWLDQTSLIPCSAKCKVWPEVFSYIKDLRPKIIRFPGGCFADCYHWESGVGDPDFRPSCINHHWGGMEENGFGTDEFIALCKELGCEPMICVNFGSAPPEEAANWVEYCNGPIDSFYGAMRARNGHPDPYNVTYWDIGNEAFADWEIGHCDADEYCERFRKFADAMRSIDPRIKLISCGGDGNSSSQEWNRILCKKIGDVANYLGIHNYTPLTHQRFPDINVQYCAVAGAPYQYERRMKETIQTIASFGSSMELAITEWNCNYQDGSNQEQTMEAAICNAGMLHAFFRLGIPISNISDLINGWPGGIIRSAGGHCFGTPTYHMLNMYSHAEPISLLDCTYASPVYNIASVGNIQQQDSVPVIDIVACRMRNGQNGVFAVNRSLDESYALKLSAQRSASKAFTICAEPHNSYNTQSNEKIVPKENSVLDDLVKLPPCSITLIWLH